MNEEPVEQWTFDELHKWAAGELLLAIGEGKFRERLWSVMSTISRVGYERGLNDAKRKKGTKR